MPRRITLTPNNAPNAHQPFQTASTQALLSALPTTPTHESKRQTSAKERPTRRPEDFSISRTGNDAPGRARRTLHLHRKSALANAPVDDGNLAHWSSSVWCVERKQLQPGVELEDATRHRRFHDVRLCR